MVTLHVLTIKYWRSREETSWITMEVCLSIYQNCIIDSEMNLVTDVISIWETRSVEWIRGEGELWLKLLSLNALLHMNMVCVLSIYSNYNFFFYIYHGKPRNTEFTSHFSFAVYIVIGIVQAFKKCSFSLSFRSTSPI